MNGWNDFTASAPNTFLTIWGGETTPGVEDPLCLFLPGDSSGDVVPV